MTDTSATETAKLEAIVRTVRLMGGKLCLDFANTVEYRGSDREFDLLVNYRLLVRWGIRAEIVSLDEGERLLREAGAAQADATFRRALQLREVIYRIFVACTQGLSVPADELAALNAALTTSIVHRKVALTAEGPRWDWQEWQSPDRVLGPVVLSAAELLTSDELARVRQCPGCKWMFLDESPKHNRVWCDMRICGNRAKAQRHYRRQKLRRLANG
jgi:predicted RNA-binding Zn ribbon-like protein